MYSCGAKEETPCMLFLLFEVSSEFSLREGDRDRKIKSMLKIVDAVFIYLGDKW